MDCFRNFRSLLWTDHFGEGEPYDCFDLWGCSGLSLYTPQALLHYENWETLLFVFGMMIVIETMSESGFFLWLGLHNAKWVKLDPLKLFILFPFIAGFFSAFVDSDYRDALHGHSDD